MKPTKKLTKRKPATKPAKRPARKPAPATRPAPVTALARRETHAEDLIPVEVPSAYLTENPLNVDFGTPVKFTDQEQAILSEPVNPDDIRIKPSGQPYLPHIVYTRWFNRALGMGQWYLRPLSIPTRKKTAHADSVMMPYALIVRGRPVATTYGEAEYHENNRDQSLGDAVESIHASALRRCAKRLGISLEMWDKEFIDCFVEDHAVLVKVSVKRWDRQTNGWKRQVRKQWRLRTSPKFPGEMGLADQTEYDDEDEPQRQRRTPPPSSPPPAQAERPVAAHPGQDRFISPPQVNRLWALAGKFKRNADDVAAFLKTDYGVKSSREILRRDYENICTAFEQEGPLRRIIDVGSREPGQEG